ncbi:MAG: hypothetical protein ACKOYJ_04825 [Planctomycetia bacterium]
MRCRITAGNSGIQYRSRDFNGQLVSETIDEQPDTRSMQGVLAPLLHAGLAITVLDCGVPPQDAA